MHAYIRDGISLLFVAHVHELIEFLGCAEWEHLRIYKVLRYFIIGSWRLGMTYFHRK